jgi:hypothetical protein
MDLTSKTFGISLSENISSMIADIASHLKKIVHFTLHTQTK